MDGLFDKLQKIPTLYYISEDNENTLSESAEVIISAEQEEGWKVGPICETEDEPIEVKTLGEAFAFAILRSHLSDLSNQDWASPFFSGSEAHRPSKWCKSAK